MKTSIKKILLTAVATSMMSTGVALAGELTSTDYSSAQNEEGQIHEVASTEMVPDAHSDSKSVIIEKQFDDTELYEDYELDASWSYLY